MQGQFPPYEGVFSTTVLAPRRRRPYEQCAFKADTLCSVPETEGIDVFSSESDHQDATIGFESREDAVMARLRELSGLFFCYGELCEVRLKSEVPEPLRRVVKPMPIDANNATELPPRNVSGSTWLCRLASMLLYALLLIFCAVILTVVYVASTTFVWLQLWLLEWVVYFAKQLLLDQIKAALVNWIRPRASAWLATFFLTASVPAEVADADEVDEEPIPSDDGENWTRLIAVYEWWTFVDAQTFLTASDPAEPADAGEVDEETTRTVDDDNCTCLSAACEWSTFDAQTFFLTTSDPAEAADAGEVDEVPGRSAVDENWTWLSTVYEWWTFDAQVMHDGSNEDAPSDASDVDYEVELPAETLLEGDLIATTDERVSFNDSPLSSSTTSGISSMTASDASALP